MINIEFNAVKLHDEFRFELYHTKLIERLNAPYMIEIFERDNSY